MKKLTFYLFLCMLSINVIAQESINADIVVYGNDQNTEFVLKNLVTNAIATENGGCINFNLVSSLEEATQPYVFEMWDSEEFISQYIFKETRNKKTTNSKGEETTTAKTVAGIKVRAIYQVAGRLIEKESGNVIDVFVLGDVIDREIPVDEVKKKYRLDKRDNEALSDKVLSEYTSRIEAERDSTIVAYERAIKQVLVSPISLYILPPPSISGIAEQKKEKVKSVTIDFCRKEQLYRYGNFYHPIIAEQEVFGEKIYPEVATYYGDTKFQEFGIRKGEEALLPLIKNGTKLLATRPEFYASHRLSAHKNPGAHKIDFVMEFPMLHDYSDFERKYIELLLQSSFIGLKNVMVIANDPITEKINASLSNTREKQDSITTQDALSKKSNQSIRVQIGNQKRPSDEKSNSLFAKRTPQASPDSRYILMNFVMKLGDKEYTHFAQMVGKSSKKGLVFKTIGLEMKEFFDPLLDLDVQMLGIYEEKKDKVKKVYIKGNSMLSEGAKYKVYDKKRITKKLKPVAEIKIDELVHSNIAIAEVKKGDKVLKALMKKNLYLVPSGGGGLAGFLSGGLGPESTTMTIAYVKETRM